MVLQNYVVIALVVIKSKIKLMQRRTFDFLCFQSQEVHLFVVQNFTLLVIGERVHEVLQSLGRADWELNLDNLGLVFLALISFHLQLRQPFIF